MLNEHTSLTVEPKNHDKICSICNKEITKDDLVHISEHLTVHFKCYIEIQDKICACCGKPFTNQEILLYCNEHKEYFHGEGECLRKHLQKHMPFKKVRYDASRNRMTFLDISDDV